jgi:hypothetical protein
VKKLNVVFMNILSKISFSNGVDSCHILLFLFGQMVGSEFRKHEIVRSADHPLVISASELSNTFQGKFKMA